MRKILGLSLVVWAISYAHPALSQQRSCVDRDLPGPWDWVTLDGERRRVSSMRELATPDGPPCFVVTTVETERNGVITSETSPAPNAAPPPVDPPPVPPEPAPQDPTTLPRLQLTDITYAGAFRFPAGSTDCTKFNYGGSVLAYDVTRDSLWGVGHAQCQPIAEITIPTPGTGTFGSLPRATLKTNWIQTPWRTSVGGSRPLIGGILPQPNGDLIVSAYEFYDSGNIQITSHFRRAADGTVSGPFKVDTSSHVVNPNKAGSVSGYMGWVPQEWRALFGGSAFMGNCCLSIISRTSLGPALTVFDPASVGTSNPIPAKELLGYPITQPTLGTTASTFNPTTNPPTIYNGSVNNSFFGVTWIDGTRTILALEKIGVGPVSYSSGYQAGQEILYMLAYDPLDLLAVKNGQKRPYEVIPYAHGFFDIGPALKTLGIPGPLAVNTDEHSITYDPTRKRLYISFHTGISGGEHLVTVWNVAGGSTVPPPPPPPPADTILPSVQINANPITVLLGQTINITADALDNVGVVGVQFTANDAPIGAEQLTAPYALLWLPPSTGVYTLRAIARDAANNTSPPIAGVVVAVNPVPVPPPPPPDSDGDGVPDSTDACPTVAGSQADGCPPPFPPPSVIPPPVVTLRSCSTYLAAPKPAEATGTNWRVQYYEGSTEITTSSLTIQRAYVFAPGSHSVWARWTKGTLPPLESPATVFVCGQ